MRLYATVTTERASKGQGGNNFIRAEFSVEKVKVFEVELLISPSGTCYYLQAYSYPNPDGLKVREYFENIPIMGVLTKGKRQKGEKVTETRECWKCGGKSMLHFTKENGCTVLEKETCASCGDL